MISNPKRSVALALALSAGCNWIAGIDERETRSASGGAGGVQHGGSGGRGTEHSGGVSDAGAENSGGTLAATGGTDAGAGGASEGGASGNADGGVPTASGGVSEAGGGAVARGGASTTGGSNAAKGGAAGAAGGAQKGGAGGTAGTSGKGGAGGKGGVGGTAGASGSGPCLGYPNELVTDGWYINTTQGSPAQINPPASDSGAGQFQNGECARVSGTRGGDEGWALLYFVNEAGVPFSSLDIKLVSASPDLALPTLHILPKDGEHDYCRTFSDAQVATLRRGETLRISNTELHYSDCNAGDEDMPAGQAITQVKFQVDSYERNGRFDFDFCVLKLTVNP